MPVHLTITYIEFVFSITSRNSPEVFFILTTYNERSDARTFRRVKERYFAAFFVLLLKSVTLYLHQYINHDISFPCRLM